MTTQTHRHEPRHRPRTAPSIVVGAADMDRLRSVVESHLVGRDQPAAERLEAELDRARVVPQAEVPADTVAMGSRIVFEDVENARRREITLSYPRDADPAAGRISILAPVATALLGLRVGDAIAWPLPGGREVTLRITAVLGAPEAAPALAR